MLWVPLPNALTKETMLFILPQRFHYQEEPLRFASSIHCLITREQPLRFLPCLVCVFASF